MALAIVNRFTLGVENGQQSIPSLSASCVENGWLLLESRLTWRRMARNGDAPHAGGGDPYPSARPNHDAVSVTPRQQQQCSSLLSKWQRRVRPFSGAWRRRHASPVPGGTWPEEGDRRLRSVAMRSAAVLVAWGCAAPVRRARARAPGLLRRSCAPGKLFWSSLRSPVATMASLSVTWLQLKQHFAACLSGLVRTLRDV